jgi:putative DNA-invertase from lambdoid prophage Rac
MSHRIAYYRVSGRDQSVEAQRHAMGGEFDQEFSDEGVSGGVMASERPGFKALLNILRSGDTVCVYAVDRLGRDALDVQSTVRSLMNRGIVVDVHGLGPITQGTGELILAVLAQIAEMERRRIIERVNTGIAAAKASLATTGLTHRGKEGFGRTPKHEAVKVVAWRRENQASIPQTAKHFKVSEATVKRYCAMSREPATEIIL